MGRFGIFTSTLFSAAAALTLFSAALVAVADTAGVVYSGAPPGYESYASRPDILSVTPKPVPDLGPDWRKLKRGHLEAVAMLLEMYPDREIYFLARDSELLYDLARLETQTDPARQARLHLLNVSRANMRAEHVRDYLAQEGISEKALNAGKKILFVDTGFSGTISKTLSEYFPPELRKQLKTHLMSSINPEHPSTRVFLTAVNPAAPSLDPGSMHGSIVSYEHLPRYLDRSISFARIGPKGEWEPVSKVGASSDGLVSKTKALSYMQDLKAYANESDFRTLMSRRREQWSKLRKLSESPLTDHPQLVAELKAMLDVEGPEAAFSEALIRDFTEIQARNATGGIPVVQLQELGLTAPKEGASSKMKFKLIQKHPEWVSILENPEDGIPALIHAGEWGTLGAICDALEDVEFFIILAKTLGSLPATPEVKHFLQMLIEQSNDQVINAIATYTFSQPHSMAWRDLLRILIEKADSATLQSLAKAVFSRPHAAGFVDEFKLLIERGDAKTHLVVVQYVFENSHSAALKDGLRLLLEKADDKTVRYIKEYTLRESHWAGVKEAKIFREAARIRDSAGRRQFLNERLGPMSTHASAEAACIHKALE